MIGRIQAPPGMSLHAIGSDYKFNLLEKQNLNLEQMNFNQYLQNSNLVDSGINKIQEKVQNIALEPSPVTNFGGFLEDDDDELPPPPPPVLSTLSGSNSINNSNSEHFLANQGSLHTSNVQFQETMQYLPSGQIMQDEETDRTQKNNSNASINPTAIVPSSPLVGSFNETNINKNDETFINKVPNESVNTNQPSSLLMEIQTGIKLKVFYN